MIVFTIKNVFLVILVSLTLSQVSIALCILYVALSEERASVLLVTAFQVLESDDILLETSLLQGEKT